MFDDYLDDECDPPAWNRDVKGHEDVDIEDTPTLDVYLGYETFDVHCRSMPYCNDLESSSKSMKEFLVLSFMEDVDIEMHYNEDPFMEAYASRSQSTFLLDLIVRYWIKTLWAYLMDAQWCKYTIQRQHQ